MHSGDIKVYHVLGDKWHCLYFDDVFSFIKIGVISRHTPIKPEMDLNPEYHFVTTARGYLSTHPLNPVQHTPPLWQKQQSVLSGVGQPVAELQHAN